MARLPNTEYCCEQCGYCLDGLARRGRCPECGTPFDHRNLKGIIAYNKIGCIPSLITLGGIVIAIGPLICGACIVLPSFVRKLLLIILCALLVGVWYSRRLP